MVGGEVLTAHVIEPVAVAVQAVPGQQAAEPVALHMRLRPMQEAVTLVGGAVETTRA